MKEEVLGGGCERSSRNIMDVLLGFETDSNLGIGFDHSRAETGPGD